MAWNLEVYIDNVVVKSKLNLGHLIDLQSTFERMSKHQLKMNLKKCAFGVSAWNFLGFLRRFIANSAKKFEPFSSLQKLKDEDQFTWEEIHQKDCDSIKEYLSKPPVLVPPKWGRPLKLYISASENSIGSLLAQGKDD